MKKNLIKAGYKRNAGAIDGFQKPYGGIEFIVVFLPDPARWSLSAVKLREAGSEACSAALTVLGATLSESDITTYEMRLMKAIDALEET